jgi:hypothetical protein
MRPRILVFLLCFPAVAAPALAQPFEPPVHLFAGYSLLPADAGDDFPRGTSHGVQLGASVRLTDWLAVLGDVGVQVGTRRDLGPGFQGLTARTRVLEFFAGPQFSARSGRVRVFAHGLVGLVHGDAGEDFSGFTDTALGFGGGGGIDIGIRDRVALRSQFDLLASFADIVEGNTRFSVGLVFGLGGS